MKNIDINFLKGLPVSVQDDPIVMGELDGYTLAAPESFWACPNDIRSEVINGCGPSGMGDIVVPDTAYFLSLKPACKIHDWMFTIFNDEPGFKLSNQLFLDNMNRINHARTKNKILRWLRSRRIRKYFRAVRDFGRLFFYDAHVGLYSSEAVYS